MGLQGSGNSSENFVKLQGYTRAHPRCLFLFDNADDLSIVEEYLPSIPSLHILVTTRRSFVDSPRLGGARIHGLEPFKSDVGVRLLLALQHTCERACERACKRTTHASRMRQQTISPREDIYAFYAR